jgi:outer membrane protein assembly factor BamB
MGRLREDNPVFSVSITGRASSLFRGWGGVLVLSLVLGSLGCSSTPEVKLKPAKLVQFSPSFSVSVDWKRALDGATGGRFSPLQMGEAEENLVVADQTGRLYLIDRESGKVVQTRELDQQLQAGPISADDQIVVGTRKGMLMAFDTAQLNPIWEIFLGGELIAAPVISRGSILARTVNGKLYALSRATGEVRWVYERPPPALSLRGNSRPIVVDGVVFAGWDTGRAAALNLADGQLFWEVLAAQGQGRTEVERIIDIDSDPLFRGGKLFLASYQDRIVALDAQTGRQIWDRKFSPAANMAADNLDLYAVSDQGHIWAFSQSSGATRWMQDTLQGRSLSAPVVWGEHLCVGDFEGYVHCLNRENGEMAGRVRVASGPVVADMIESGDSLFVLTLDGTLARVSSVKN